MNGSTGDVSFLDRERSGEIDPMSPTLTADDLWPLVEKLSHDQQVKLARRALLAAARSGSDAAAYRAAPPSEDEFGSDEDGGAWEAEGWEEFHAPR